MRRRSSSECHSDADREKERIKEKERRRLAWMKQQERERQHEELKRKKIEEYERKRAEQLGLARKRRSSLRSRSESRSRSRSEESHHRSHSKSATNNRSQVMSEKLNSSEGNRPFFTGPQEPPALEPSSLHQITIKITRKIPAPATETSEIRRDVFNPEEITLKRRMGEGAKPIFDRDELKQAQSEVEEFRTIEAVNKNSLVKKSHQKRRSASHSPRRHHRSPSPHSSRSYSHRSRSEAYSKHHSEDHYYKDYKTERHYSRTRDSSREDSRRHNRRSRSRERDYHKSERDYSRSSRGEKEYREYRKRSKDRSYERREARGSSRERRLPPAQYVEPVPFPVYYGGFAPRPMLVGPPMPPLRGPMVRSRLPGAPLRPPYPPRFIGGPDMYRAAVLPPDPRYGRMY